MTTTASETEKRPHADIRNTTKWTIVVTHPITIARITRNWKNMKAVETRNDGSHDERLKTTIMTTTMKCKRPKFPKHKTVPPPIAIDPAETENVKRTNLEISIRAAHPNHTSHHLEDTKTHTTTMMVPTIMSLAMSEQVDQRKRAANTMTETIENEKTETTNAPRKTNTANAAVTIENEKMAMKTQMRKSQDGDPENINANTHRLEKTAIETATDANARKKIQLPILVCG